MVKGHNIAEPDSASLSVFMVDLPCSLCLEAADSLRKTKGCLNNQCRSDGGIKFVQAPLTQYPMNAQTSYGSILFRQANERKPGKTSEAETKEVGISQQCRQHVSVF